jgi:hypothetical protein
MIHYIHIVFNLMSYIYLNNLNNGLNISMKSQIYFETTVISYYTSK